MMNSVMCLFKMRSDNLFPIVKILSCCLEKDYPFALLIQRTD